MQKIQKYLAVASVLASMSVANAEKSGAFVGLEAGVSIFNLEQKLAGQIGRNFYSSGNYGGYGIGGNYGLIVGYKQFFTPQLGLRYYANLNYTHSLTSLNGNTRVSFYNVLNYGVNVDFLANLVSKEIEDFGSLDFGGFIGLGLGANTEFIRGTNLDVALNVGLRTTFYSKHSLELISRVPFLPTTKGNKSATKLIYREPIYDYSLSLRYVYSF